MFSMHLQDYLYVVEFTRCFARVLATAPVQHYAVLIGGLAALSDELQWYQVIPYFFLPALHGWPVNFELCHVKSRCCIQAILNLGQA